MGIFRTAANRLSMLFAGAPSADVARVNAALKQVATDALIAEGNEQVAERVATGLRASRKQRREYSHSFRQRTRNSAFSRRDKVATPKAQHEQANSKGWQYASNLLLQSLVLPIKEAQVSA